jgi:hypothetical protein
MLLHAQQSCFIECNQCERSKQASTVLLPGQRNCAAIRSDSTPLQHQVNVLLCLQVHIVVSFVLFSDLLRILMRCTDKQITVS